MLKAQSGFSLLHILNYKRENRFSKNALAFDHLRYSRSVQIAKNAEACSGNGARDVQDILVKRVGMGLPTDWIQLGGFN
jgi:hypothetical protein